MYYLVIILLLNVNLLFSLSNTNNMETIMEEMTLKEKISQMIMVRVRSDYYSNDSYYKKNIEDLITNRKVGGLCTFDGNGNVHGMFNNHKYFQEISNIPLLISSDLERGAGQQMKGATLFPSNMGIAATNEPKNAYKQGKITAIEAKALGINIILAPVLDVNNNPKNPIINLRSYSDDPNIVTNFGLEFIKGIQDQGLFACPKHFPGHGNTSVDSHSSLPTINSTLEELKKVELKPFKNAVENNVKMIMIGHIAMPALDSSNKPATHSKKITTNLLINKWNFKGLVITDGMEMTGITKEAWSGESAIRAIEAGSDIILLPINVDKTIQSIYNAVISNRLNEERINHSVLKILQSKKELDLFNYKFDYEKMSSIVGTRENLSIADKIASSSITLVKDSRKNIPIKPENYNNMVHIILSDNDNANQTLKSFKSNINYTHGNVKNIFVNYELSNLVINELVEKTKMFDKVIISTLVKISSMNKGKSTLNKTHLKFIKKLSDSNISPVVVSFGSPYLDDYSFIDTYICCYGYGSVSQIAAANAIFGRRNINGILPINLNNNYKRGDGIKRFISASIFENNTKIDFSSSWKIIDKAINEKLFPGAQILIIKNGKIMADKHIGNFTFSSGSKKVDKNTLYDVASITKVLATTPVIMQLVKKKFLDLDHELKQFYPEIKIRDKSGITIRHLLTHSSGLPAYIDYYKNKNINSKSDIIKDIIENQELLFIPGSKFKYSDLGMILLMDIAEIVLGRNFGELVNSWVFKPLEMNNSFFNPSKKLWTDIAPTEIDNTYRKDTIQGVVHDENAYIMDGISGHAGIFSNAYDIAKYAQTMINYGLYKGRRVYDKNYIKKFTKKQNIPLGSDFAIGWDTPSNNGNSSAGDYFSEGSYGHLGFTGTSLWIDPKQKVIVILLTNRTYPNRDKIGMHSLRRVFHNEIMKTLIDRS